MRKSTKFGLSSKCIAEYRAWKCKKSEFRAVFGLALSLMEVLMKCVLFDSKNVAAVIK